MSDCLIEWLVIFFFGQGWWDYYLLEYLKTCAFGLLRWLLQKIRFGLWIWIDLTLDYSVRLRLVIPFRKGNHEIYKIYFSESIRFRPNNLPNPTRHLSFAENILFITEFYFPFKFRFFLALKEFRFIVRFSLGLWCLYISINHAFYYSVYHIKFNKVQIFSLLFWFLPILSFYDFDASLTHLITWPPLHQ